MRGDTFFTQVAKRSPFTKLHPRVGAFFKEHFAQEKVVPFGDQFVVNTNFPPYPSAAFDHLTEQFAQLGDAATRRLYSVTLAVTNRCPFHCWHFQYDSAAEVLEHLLKSGAGTALYDTVDPARRIPLARRFLQMLEQRRGPSSRFEVCHEYVACVAGRS